ncbi:hypothetical protein DRL16_22090 [Salmonella enterica subsp. enterica serovar Bredeney]|nr:hypothetical protein [Salmonella enterica subsp. enterica serovar Bredeney]EBY2599555.1 hypothetical protein [Salmonella enterica subsp. enterica serovar Bredeney]
MKIYVVVFFLILAVFVCFVNGYMALVCLALSLFMVSRFFSPDLIFVYIAAIFLSFIFLLVLFYAKFMGTILVIQ